ncbi:MAG: hypothetical protein ACI4J0_03435 [Huintestinicola sp.]|uniref:hypothetical protein n=1 Tax=Huintestinicola sp. TaxID=2981661 RepID=UPI003EFBB192
MNDFENVSELVNKTGASFEEARYAYEACGKDMVEAAIMLEKAHSKSSGRSRFNAEINSAKQSFRRNSRRAADCAGSLFGKLCRNNVRIAGSREYFRIPVIAAVICALLLWEIIVPVVLISILFGVTYTFFGPDFSKEFVFGFSKPVSAAQSAPTYTYTKPDEPCDNGFFNK